MYRGIIIVVVVIAVIILTIIRLKPPQETCEAERQVRVFLAIDVIIYWEREEAKRRAGAGVSASSLRRARGEDRTELNGSRVVTYSRWLTEWAVESVAQPFAPQVCVRCCPTRCCFFVDCHGIHNLAERARAHRVESERREEER